MTRAELEQTLLEVARECARQGPGFAHEAVVLREAADRTHVGSDIGKQQALLTCWHDLFRAGKLSWGYDVDNPGPPFFHFPPGNPTRVIEGGREDHAALRHKVVTILESQAAERRCTSNTLVREFHRLAAIWKMETVHISDVREKCLHPAYQQIIALGQDVLPLIFDELEIDPDDWFVALKAITGVDPIPAGHRFNFEEMVHGWLAWGKSHGYSLRDRAEAGFPEPQLEDVRR